MRVFSYSPYDDTGGIGWNLSGAFRERRPDWTYNATTGAPSYLQFPIRDPWDWTWIIKTWKNADAVHVHDGFHEMPTQRRGIVVTWHGTGFREVPDVCLKNQNRFDAIGLVSTLDLWLMRPDDVTWCPAPVDIPWMASMRTYAQRDKIRIGHTPTNRSLKSTAELIAACERIPEVELVIVEGKSWEEALKIKGTFDVLFDQTAYSYGGSAIEAMAMGIPVICGAPDAVMDEFSRRFGYIPFVYATPGTVEDAVRSLLDPVARARWGAIGKTHVENWHSYPSVVSLLSPIYREAASRA